MSEEFSSTIERIYGEFVAWLLTREKTPYFGEVGVKRQIVAAIDRGVAPTEFYLWDFLQSAGYVGELEEIKPDTEIPDTPDSILQMLIAGITGSETARIEATLGMAERITGASFVEPAYVSPEHEPIDEHPMLKHFQDIGILDDEAVAWILGVMNTSGIKGGLLMGAIAAGLGLSFITNIGEIAGGEFYKSWLAKFTPNVPVAMELLKPWLLDSEKRSDYEQAMRENGLSDTHIDMLLKNNEYVFQPDSVRDLWWRKLLTDEQAIKELERLGFSPDRISIYMESWKVIPSPQDILYMVAREAFEPDQIREFGLDQEFPGAQSEWLEKRGVTRFWQEKYWAAHWQPIPLEMGLRMLHRRVITEAELDSLMRVHEIAPAWREKIRAISYNPITRVDIRRIRRAGIIDYQEVYDAYRNIGYNDKNSRIMADWTEQEYGSEQKELTKSQIEKAYDDGFVSESEAITLLEELGYTREQANWLTDQVELEKAKRLLSDRIDLVKTRFLNHFIDTVSARAELSKLEITQPRVELYIQEWELKLALDVKLPSKTDLSKWYKSGLINEDQYLTFLKQLGYDPTIADLYLKYDKKILEG